MILRNPLNKAFTGDRRGNKTALEKIAASWRLPVDHFAGTKYTRHPAQHQLFIELVPGDTARAGDRFFNRPGSFEADTATLCCGYPIVKGLRFSNLFDQRDSRSTQSPEPHRPLP